MEDPRPLIEEITAEEFEELAREAEREALICEKLANSSRLEATGGPAAKLQEAAFDYWMEKAHTYEESAKFVGNEHAAWEDQHGQPIETRLAGLKSLRTAEASRRAKSEVSS